MIPQRTSVLDRFVVAFGALLLAGLSAVSGCGGGVGVGGTGAFAAGPITGFGSIIVNGIEFDDAAAKVFDEDGAASNRSALKLGMFAEVESGALGGTTAAPTATATAVRFSSELVGPVESVDLAASSLVVMGQAVKVNTTTVFDDTLASGLASVATGSVVEVYGFRDATAYIATRIEVRSAAAAFKVHGPVRALSTAARTFSIGNAGFVATTLPAGVAEGDQVRVRVDPVQVAGRWNVLRFGEARRTLPDSDRARLRGPITAFTSSRAFSVNGQTVDAATASFPNGEAGVVLGAKVLVEGSTVAGVLRATEVRVDDNGGAQGDFELKGTIETHQPALQLFGLRGVTVFYGANGLQFEGGAATDLRVGAEVEVRGVLGAGGTRLLATRIKIK